MDWTSVMAALITAAGALLGTYLANRRSAALIEYRLQCLEDKVGRHNGFAQRMPLVEERMEQVTRRVERLERREGL